MMLKIETSSNEKAANETASIESLLAGEKAMANALKGATNNLQA